jgi:hypothetical protein
VTLRRQLSTIPLVRAHFGVATRRRTA